MGLDEMNLEKRQAEAASTLQRRHEIKQQIDELQRASIGNGDPEQRAAISRELAFLDSQLQRTYHP